MPELKRISQYIWGKLRGHRNIGYVLLYISALRGSNVALLIIISHLVDIVTYGKISAVYVFVMSGAQIIGLPLIALALRSVGHSREKCIQDSIFWWAVISVFVVVSYLALGRFLTGILFSGSIDTAMISMGCFWMCAMGLEILAGALAASSGKLRTMAIGSVVQAAATLSIAPASIWILGELGLFLIPVCGLTAGAIMVARVFDWRELGATFHEWRRGAISHLIVTMGPAAIAALSVTLLSMTLVSITATSPGAYLDLAIFGIALQLVGVSTFVPQVLSNSALESGHRAARDGTHWRKTLARWTLLSLGVSGAIGLVIATLGGSFAILYADGYSLPAGLLSAAGVLVALIGPVNVLSHILIIGGRQWLSAAICLISTIVVIGCFVVQPSRSSEAMVWALVASNAIRFLAMTGFASLELHQLKAPGRPGKSVRKS